MKTLCSGLFIFVFFSCAGILSAQKTVVDSLKSMLQQHPEEDTVRAKILLKLAYHESFDDYYAFKTRVLELDQLTQKIGDNYWIAQAWRQKSEVFIDENELDSAYQILNDALVLSQAYHTPKWSDLRYDILLNLAGLFHETNPQLAFKYMDEALATLKNSQKMERVCALYGNKAILYKDINHLDSSEIYFKISMDCFLSQGDSLTYVQCLRLYSDVLLAKGNFTNAIQNYLLASAFYKNKQLNDAEVPSLFGLARAYMKLNDYSIAKRYIDRLESIKSLGEQTILSLYELKYQWFEAVGQHDSTVFYLTKYIKLKDQIYQNEKKNSLERYEVRMRIKQQELENLKYKVQTDQIYFRNTLLSIILIVALLLIFFLIVYQWQIRKSNRQLNSVYKEMSALVELRQFFTSLLAHDLRSPLQAIILKTSTLLKQQSENQILNDIIQYSRVIQQKVSRIAEVQNSPSIRAMEDVHKIEVHELLDISVSNQFLLANEKRITIKKLYHGYPLLDIVTNVEIFGYILDNLLNNAIKYTPAGGEIVINVLEEYPEKINIFINDNGPGIKTSHFVNIYQYLKTNFFKLDDGWKIGLGLTKYFVNQLGGTIMFLNIGKSSGTTIKLTFPKVNSKFQLKSE
ncbi:MAG: HAMP domain-containing histidine kinase [Saprospiraceae bacterium]|nr:HAMP domain-containing histidine kinase [Saprospiraceae bacterium]